MRPPSLSDQLTRHPEDLLEVVIDKLGLKSDAALARMLGVAPSCISHIRRCKLPVSQPILVRMLEETQLHIRELVQNVECWNPPTSATLVRRRPSWGGKCRPPVRHSLLSAQLVAHPNELLDAVIGRLHLMNDRALAQALGLTPSAISSIRHRRFPVGAAILVRMLEATQLHIRELHQLVQSRISPKTIAAASDLISKDFIHVVSLSDTRDHRCMLDRPPVVRHSR